MLPAERPGGFAGDWRLMGLLFPPLPGAGGLSVRANEQRGVSAPAFGAELKADC